MTLATKIAVMKDGEVQQFGTPAEIYNSPANIFVADFMGSPAMNLVPASVRVENGKTVVVVARSGEDDLVLDPGRVRGKASGRGWQDRALRYPAGGHHRPRRRRPQRPHPRHRRLSRST